MGSELPGGQRKKKKIFNSDDRSTNKIYASGEISALGNNRTVADSTIKPGDMDQAVLKGNKTPTQKQEDKAADKYYANGGSDRKKVTKTQLKQQKAANGIGKPLRQAGPPKPPSGLIVVNSKDQVAAACAAAVEKVKNEEKAVVYIAAGATDLLKRTRAHLDLMVTRETITEDEYRDIRLAYVGADEVKAPPPPKPAEAKKADDGMVDQDPLDFLNGDDDGDVIDTSPLTDGVTVDTTNDVKDPEAAAIEAEVKAENPAVADDDGGDDFLTPSKDTKVETPALAETEETELPPVEDTLDRAVPTDTPRLGHPDPALNYTPTPAFDPEAGATAAEDMPKKKGKRSGRGS